MNLIGLIGDMSICKLMICSKKNYIFNLTFKKKKKLINEVGFTENDPLNI